MSVLRLLPFLFVTACLPTHAATQAAPSNPAALSDQSFSAGLAGLTQTSTAPETLLSDQFRYENEDRDHCKHAFDEERCSRPVHAVPEPSAYLMTGIGALGLLAVRMFRRRRT